MQRALRAVVLPILLLSLTTNSASAQDLTLKRTVPGDVSGACTAAGWPGVDGAGDQTAAGASREPEAEDRAEAARLAGTASQPMLLGDYSVARDILQRAAALDPTSEDIAYRLGRSLEELGRSPDAIAEYCRFLLLAPGSSDADEVRDRIRRLTTSEAELAISDAALGHFTRGIAYYEARELPEAGDAFADAVEEAPEWADAHYNRAVVHALQNRDSLALAGLEEYLALRPDAPDVDRVRGAIDRLRPDPPGTPAPAGALAAGMLVPGLGHMYSGRTGRGLLVLGVAGGAAAAGLLYEQVNITCLGVPVEGECPENQVVERTTEQPYLVPGLAVAAAATVLGAIDAYRGAASRRAAARSDGVGSNARPGDGPRFAMPAVRTTRTSLRLEWLRVRF